MEMMHMGFGLGFLNFIGTLLFIVFMVWVLKAFVLGRGMYGRRYWRRMRYAGMPCQDADPMHAARERFARGELSEEQYQGLKDGLKGVRSEEGEWAPWKAFIPQDRALQVARLRYAKGEIGLEEFEAIKRGLEG